MGKFETLLSAALVAQMAAAASSLKSQAQDLVQLVALLKLGAGEFRSPLSRFARF